MLIFAIILLILIALVILAGVILSSIAGIWPVPRFDLQWPFPTPPPNDYIWLIRTLTSTDSLWHPGRGDLPDPSGETPVLEFPNHPME